MTTQTSIWVLTFALMGACSNNSAGGVQGDAGSAGDGQVAGDVADVALVADADPTPCGAGFHHCACGMGATDCVPDNDADADSVDGLAGPEAGDAGCVPGTVKHDMENLCPDGQTWVFAVCTAAGTWTWQNCPGPDASPADIADAAADGDAKVDAVTVDVPVADAESSDVPVDAGSPQICTVPGTDMCSDTSLSCQCCPAGGPLNHCLCAETCMSSIDCKDPARPECKVGPGTKSGFCAPTTFTCCWLCL